MADAKIAAMPSESIQSEDWKLDVARQVRHEQYPNHKVLVIAVSSRRRDMKLLFVEVVFPGVEFSPLQLLKRLFPENRGGHPLTAHMRLH